MDVVSGIVCCIVVVVDDDVFEIGIYLFIVEGVGVCDVV